MHRVVLPTAFTVAFLAFTVATPSLFAAVKETVVYDESKQGDLGAAKPDAEAVVRVSVPGVYVIRGTGTDAVDDVDAFVFQVEGERAFDFCLVADAAEFKKLRAIDRFCPTVRGRAMEYYHYHWDGNRGPHMHFALLEQYRQASALNGDVPICRIVETRPEDMRKTRQTIYTSLADSQVQPGMALGTCSEILPSPAAPKAAEPDDGNFNNRRGAAHQETQARPSATIDGCAQTNTFPVAISHPILANLSTRPASAIL